MCYKFTCLSRCGKHMSPRIHNCRESVFLGRDCDDQEDKGRMEEFDFRWPCPICQGTEDNEAFIASGLAWKDPFHGDEEAIERHARRQGRIRRAQRREARSEQGKGKKAERESPEPALFDWLARARRRPEADDDDETDQRLPDSTARRGPEGSTMTEGRNPNRRDDPGRSHRKPTRRAASPSSKGDQESEAELLRLPSRERYADMITSRAYQRRPYSPSPGRDQSPEWHTNKDEVAGPSSRKEDTSDDSSRPSSLYEEMVREFRRETIQMAKDKR